MSLLDGLLVILVLLGWLGLLIWEGAAGRSFLQAWLA